ncbi:MAG: ferritin family protein [Syntrophomonas sp.]|nr:ferritin family protein [Syntrophomonas sp.]
MGWSMLKFSAEEIIEIALQMEESGKLFYEKALPLAKGDKLKEMLIYLAQEEEKHYHAFRELGSQLKYQFRPNESFAGEYEAYVKSLVDSHIFKLSEVEDLVKEIKNDRDILHFAISFEKDSIIIFQEFKNASNKEGAEILEKLINEERGHIRKINELFRSM